MNWWLKTELARQDVESGQQTGENEDKSRRDLWRVGQNWLWPNTGIRTGCSFRLIELPGQETWDTQKQHCTTLHQVLAGGEQFSPSIS